MLVGGLRQSTLFKLSVFGSCGFLTFCPTGRRRGLGEHMFNSTCPLFHPLLPSILSSIPKTSVWLIVFFLSIFLFPPFFYALLSSLLFVFHFPFALSMSILPPVVHPTAPHYPDLLERAAKEPEGAQNVARPAGERCNTGPGDRGQSRSTVPGLYACVRLGVCAV